MRKSFLKAEAKLFLTHMFMNDVHVCIYVWNKKDENFPCLSGQSTFIDVVRASIFFAIIIVVDLVLFFLDGEIDHRSRHVEIE